MLRRAEADWRRVEIAEALIAGRASQATGKQVIDLQAALSCLPFGRGNGGMVVGKGTPTRWRRIPHH